jgi:LmbE family N-acetylglucosaminyl deacetylase
MNTTTDSINILAVGAHPDDIEFGAGGVLLKEHAAGAHISIVITSRGESGSSGTPDLRESEARAAAARLGASERIHFLDFGGDGQQCATPHNAIQLARIIRKVRPTIVLAPSLHANQHPDHIAVARATRDACRLARYGGLEPLQALPLHSIDSLWFYAITPTAQTNLNASILVDISITVDNWKALMACHASQTGSRHYIDLQITRAKQLGLMAGCDYATALWPNDPPLIQSIRSLNRSARAF